MQMSTEHVYSSRLDEITVICQLFIVISYSDSDSDVFRKPGTFKSWNYTRARVGVTRQRANVAPYAIVNVLCALWRTN